MHARAIHNVLTQGRTVQTGGSNPPGIRTSPGLFLPDFPPKVDQLIRR